jgi:HSP20 family protein
MSLLKWNSNPLLPAFTSFFDDLGRSEISLPDWPKFESLPATNIEEKDNNFLIKMAVPGLEKQDIKIETDKNILKISSEKEHSEEESKKKYTRKEYSYSSFLRSFVLPENAEYNKITATCKNGELAISIPKNVEKTEKPKLVEIA